jgi:putative hydrolase of the HAD superfamily
MRAILFDFGGTLDYPRHWLDRFLRHYHSAGIDLTRAQLDLGFDHATRIGYRSTKALAGFGLVELLDFLVRQQMSFMERQGSEEVREKIAAAASGRRFDEVAGWITQSFVAESREGFGVSREVLGRLAGRFKMGVVSNFYGNLENILAEADLARFFAVIADSSRIGIFKPEPGLFINALEHIGASASDTMMVGDSLGKDCIPAQKLGMTAVWLRHAEAGAEDKTLAGDYADFTIETLAGLEQLKWLRD